MDSASLTQPSQSDDAEQKDLLANDSKFRNYAGQLEKALRSFESTAEWADLIAALGRLIKVLKENSKYSVIPHKLVLGRRLAQCMHPALPAGVHLKAIETYEMIFRATGKARLAQDLAVYGSGLFPLFPNAATNVKPILIELYENYLVRLGCGMRVALSGIVLGLLQALEVVNEHTERLSLLLDSIRDAVGRECFYTTLYRVVLNSPTIRFPALSYVLNNFDKRKTVGAQRELLGDDVRVSISALCASLQDQNSLVQRTALDVIVTFFPLHVQTNESEALRNTRPNESEDENNAELVLSESEITRLMIAALQIVLRRDTSLNRRLYAWLLGTSAAVQQLKPTSGGTGSSSDLPTPPARNRSQSVFDLSTAVLAPSQGDEETGAAAALVVGEHYFVRFAKARVIRAFRAILAGSALQSGLLSRQSASHANYAALLEAILGIPSPQVVATPISASASAIATASVPSGSPATLTPTSNAASSGTTTPEPLQSTALSQLVSLSVNQFARPPGKDAGTGSWLPCECASVELTLPAVIKPLRILISLLDKAEVSTNLLDELLLDVCSYWFELVRASTHSGTGTSTTAGASPRGEQRRADLRLTELAKIAQLFFTQLDPDYIWKLLLAAFDQLFSRVADSSVLMPENGPNTATEAENGAESEDSSDDRRPRRNSLGDVMKGARHTPDIVHWLHTVQVSGSDSRTVAHMQRPTSEPVAALLKNAVSEMRSTQLQEQLDKSVRFASMLQFLVDNVPIERETRDLLLPKLLTKLANWLDRLLTVLDREHLETLLRFAVSLLRRIAKDGCVFELDAEAFLAASTDSETAFYPDSVPLAEPVTQDTADRSSQLRSQQQKSSAGRPTKAKLLPTGDYGGARQPDAIARSRSAAHLVAALTRIRNVLGALGEAKLGLNAKLRQRAARGFSAPAYAPPDRLVGFLSTILADHRFVAGLENDTEEQGNPSTQACDKQATTVQRWYLNNRVQLPNVVLPAHATEYRECFALLCSFLIEFAALPFSVTLTDDVRPTEAKSTLISTTVSSSSASDAKRSALTEFFSSAFQFGTSSSTRNTVASATTTTIASSSSNSTASTPIPTLSSWLETLLIGACFVNDETLRFEAIKTVVELVSIAQSASLATASATSTSASTKTSIVFLAMPSAMLSMLQSRTSFLFVCALTLLDDFRPTIAVLNAPIALAYHRIWQLAPPSLRRVGDDLLSASILGCLPSRRLALLERFFVFYAVSNNHLTSLPAMGLSGRPGMASAADQNNARVPGLSSQSGCAFARTVLLVLDSLLDDSSPSLRASVQNWLLDLLRRSAFAPVFELVLLLLLDADTARVADESYAARSCSSEKMDARLKELSAESTQLLQAMRTDRFRKAPEPIKSDQVEWPPTEPSACTAPESVDSDLDLSDGEPADSVVSDILEEVIVKAVVSAEGEKPGSRAAREIPPASALQLAVTSGDVNLHTNVSEDNFEFASTVDNPQQTEQFSAQTTTADVIDAATRASACSFRLPLPNGVVRKLEHHLLYYTQRYDVARVAHALRLLSTLTTVCGADQLLRFLLRSQIGKAPCTLRLLLTRHRIATLGGNFNAHVSQSDTAAFAKQLVYAEVLLNVMLDFLRAELKPVVLDLPHVSLTDTMGNRDVQLRVLDVMFSLLTELEERPMAPLSRLQRTETLDSDDSDLSALRSLFETCQLQKLLLRTLLRSVLIPANGVATDDDVSFYYTEQLKLLRIFGTLVRLEAILYTADAYSSPPLIHAGSVTALTMLDYRNNAPLLVQPSLYYLMHTVFNVPTNCKLGTPTAIVHGRMQSVHKHWYTFVSDSLSVMSHTLPYFLHLTVNAACRNLETLLDQRPPSASSSVQWSCSTFTPADYVYSAIDHLLVTARYALTSKFDRETAKFMQLVAPSDADKLLDATSAGSGVADGAASVQQSTTGFFSSLFQSAKTVLNPLSSDEITVQRARRILLRSLLSTLRCCVQLWAGLGDEQFASGSSSLKLGPAWLCDRPKTLQSLLLAYLSLFCRTESYMQMLLYACARLWTAENRRDAVQLSGNLSTNLALFDASFVGRLTVLQRAVIDILHKLKGVTFESLTATLRELLSSPIIRKPSSSGAGSVSAAQESVLTRGGIVNSIEVGLLQLFVAFFKRFDVATVVQHRARFFWFVRECLTVRVAPHATFMLLRTVFDFANAHGGAQLQALIDDKREYRELQDCVLKCLEQVALAAGFSLEEASAFFKRNVTVRTTGGSQSEAPAIAGGNADIASIVNGEVSGNAADEKERETQPDKIGTLALAASASAAVMTIQENNLYSAQALILLGEMLTPLLDLAFRSDEKERTVTFLGPVLQFIFPYLRQHSHGTRHFSKFAVKMMASLSSFQYTRKAWRKEILDMFMDPAFFQIEPPALRYWIATVDNLLTQDRNTFKEFLSRLSAAATTVNSSITIFVNRESELMQYATLLKRLSFAIFCSERDQYSKQLGDIQDRLKECLRTQSIMLQLNAFNCFRVLLLRVTASNLANLWPLFISELQQALSALEADLLRICNERETQLSTANEYTRNLIVPLSSSIWLDAVRRAHYLVTLKLALMMLLLPEDYVPQFMPVRWLFVDDTTGNSRPPTAQPKIAEATSKKPVAKPESNLTVSAKTNDLPFKLSLSKSTDGLFGLTKSTDNSAETTRRSDSPPPTSSGCSAILNRVYAHIQRIAHAHTSRSSRKSQLNGVGARPLAETNLTTLWAKAQAVLEQRTFNAFDELETLVTLCLHASRFGAEFYASHAHASAFFGKVRFSQFEDPTIAIDTDADAPKALGQAESVGYAFGGAAPTPVFFAGTGVNPTSLNMLLVYFEHLLKLDFIEPVAS